MVLIHQDYRKIDSRNVFVEKLFYRHLILISIHLYFRGTHIVRDKSNKFPLASRNHVRRR